MKTRRHHNNKGIQQLKSGHRSKITKRLAEKLNIPFQFGENFIMKNKISDIITEKKVDFIREYNLIPNLVILGTQKDQDLCSYVFESGLLDSDSDVKLKTCHGWEFMGLTVMVNEKTSKDLIDIAFRGN